MLPVVETISSKITKVKMEFLRGWINSYFNPIPWRLRLLALALDTADVAVVVVVVVVVDVVVDGSGVVIDIAPSSAKY